jgi:hypothetical protein
MRSGQGYRNVRMRTMCPAPQLETRKNGHGQPEGEDRVGAGDEQLGDHNKRGPVRVDRASSFHEFEDGGRRV